MINPSPEVEHETVFSNASEVVREVSGFWSTGKGRPSQIEWLRTAAKEGYDDIQRGNSVSLRPDQEVTDKLGAEKTRG
ncbi:MAG: hypothetical protein R2729_33105 [Bryobacteraceae bacterium]